MKKSRTHGKTRREVNGSKSNAVRYIDDVADNSSVNPTGLRSLVVSNILNLITALWINAVVVAACLIYVEMVL